MRIAITGGIGSGKSEVLAVARKLGYATLSADEINAELLQDADYVAKIATAFPNAVKDGMIDKRALANEVFSDDEKRKKLNSIAHPEILKRFERAKANPIIIEVPLLIESGAENCFDEVVLVTAPKSVRIKRLEGRGLTKERAETIIKAQASEKLLRRAATRTIDNSGDIETLRCAANKLFHDLCS